MSRVILSVCLVVCLAGPVRAGALYSDKELAAAGDMWIETKVQWDAERLAHQRRLEIIERMSYPDSKKAALRKIELSRHHQRSNILAAKRDQVQNVLVNEANARVRGGTGKTSGDLVDTAGTRFGDKGHRGMAGDRDMGGGERTAKKVKEVLKDMGIYDPKHIKETAGTLEIGDDFELAINKTGARARPGTEFHRIKAEVDARNPETYVSESMKQRGPDGTVSKQPGTDYVEVQDHRKKASAGLASDGDGLVKNPAKAQKLAKGTVKTLDMGAVDDDTVQKILKQNGITENPAAFKRRLQAMKEGHFKVTDPADAEKLRRASEDIFNAAEQKTFSKAKREIVDMRKRAASLDAGDPKRLQLEEEIVDSVTKMKATRAAGDEMVSGKSSVGKTTRPTGGPDTTGRPTTTDGPAPRTDADAAVKNLDDIAPRPTAKARAARAFGAVMTIADIGQTCQTVEDYVDGKVSLEDATLNIVDQYVTAGAIGTAKRTKQNYDDYQAARSSIQKANQANMAAYLTQWEVRLRKAGVPPGEARRYVAGAMLSGNLGKLEDKAAELRARGKNIKPPALVVETFEADDTVGERTVNTLKAIPMGIYESGAYIVTAPKRTVEAWAQGELREAELEEYAARKGAAAKTEMFRKLVDAGIDSKAALGALNDWEDGKTMGLRKLFQQARANIEAARPTPEELAAIEAENQKLVAEAERRATLLRQAATMTNYLRFVPMELLYTPDPVEIPAEGEATLMRFAYTSGNDARLLKVADRLEKTLAALTGQPATVKLAWHYSCRGKPGKGPADWLTASPRVPGVYPVTARLVTTISGGGLTGPYAPLARTIEREGYKRVDVAVNPNLVEPVGPVWKTLARAPMVTVSMPGMSYSAKVTPSPSISFPVKKDNDEYTTEGEVSMRLSADAKMILELEIKLEHTYKKTGKLMEKFELRLVGFDLYALDEETDVKAAHGYYTIKADRKEAVGSFRTGRLNGDGELVWTKPQEIKRLSPFGRTRVHFRMVDDQMKKKWAERRKRAQQAKADRDAHKKSAAAGGAWKGPFGAKEELDGHIELDISLENKTVAGKFRGWREMGKDKRGHLKKMLVTGEFLGAIDPDTGQIEARLSKGGFWQYWYKDGKYVSGRQVNSFSKDTKIMGQMDGKTVTGHLELKGKKGFEWSATPNTEKPKDKKDGSKK